ncbi:unnamed protein product [Heligmosomoides polygyrus]|uniref:Reverse transcriptase domain-containing protein n=1 Tax=Heligmosomoides polygyrus TaxID=6339 RepID=A0A183GF72_HELPZ|nr:unnamed protein product [Heligmosomoides polygyrus]
MKLGKAAGPDGVPVEAWKVLGNCGVNWLTQFFNRVTVEGKMPDDLRNSIIVPIFKQKGDESDYSNYRGIKLISHTMKVYERLVDSRLREMVTIFQERWGFMPERSTTDAIFIARQMMEKYREKRKPCYLAFLDLEKAYDRLARAVIWNALRGRGVLERLISVIKDMYEGSKAAVRTPHGMTKKMDITVGVHQGSDLSPFLFVLTLDCIVNHLEECSLRTILYADDIALVADSREELEEKVQLWQGALADNGLRLNVKKTKFVSSEQCTEPILDCHGEMIEKVEEFRYLGSDLSEEGSVDQAVRGRINAAWLKWRESTGILCSNPLRPTLKGKLYRTVVRPALLYGCECWALGRAQERQLHAAELMLRWACGWTRQDRVRNEDVRTVMKTVPIQLKMREQRLRWYGHILRRQEDHPTKLALAPGKRPRGAPRKRWRDVIKRDLAEIGAAPDDALDRMRWRQITKAADPATALD